MIAGGDDRGAYRQRLRTVLLLHPFELPLGVVLFIVAIVFTLFPAALEHSPVSFEARGIIHHVFFHYGLLLGSLGVVIGLLWPPPRGFVIELAGLLLLLIALLLNLTAIVAADATGEIAAGGLDIAMRAAVMLGIGTRAWTILRRSTIVVRASQDA